MNKLTNKIYKIPNSLITNTLLKKYIQLFFNEVVNEVKENHHIHLLVRVQFDDNHTGNLGPYKRINKEDLDYCMEYYIQSIGLKSDRYLVQPIISLIFSYRIIEGLAPSNQKTKTKSHQIYYNNKLPIGFKPEDYGEILNTINIDKQNTIYHIALNKNTSVILTNKILINFVKYYKNNILLYFWKDIYINDQEFQREIGKSTYHFKDNILVLHKFTKSTKPITP